MAVGRVVVVSCCCWAGRNETGVVFTYMRAAIPARTSDEYIILPVDVSRFPGEYLD